MMDSKEWLKAQDRLAFLENKCVEFAGTPAESIYAEYLKVQQKIVETEKNKRFEEAV